MSQDQNKQFTTLFVGVEQEGSVVHTLTKDKFLELASRNYIFHAHRNLKPVDPDLSNYENKLVQKIY